MFLWIVYTPEEHTHQFRTKLNQPYAHLIVWLSISTNVYLLHSRKCIIIRCDFRLLWYVIYFATLSPPGEVQDIFSRMDGLIKRQLFGNVSSTWFFITIHYNIVIYHSFMDLYRLICTSNINMIIGLFLQISYVGLLLQFYLGTNTFVYIATDVTNMWIKKNCLTIPFLFCPN